MFSPIEIFDINTSVGFLNFFFSTPSFSLFTTLIFILIFFYLNIFNINIFRFNISNIFWKFICNFLLNIFKENLNSAGSLKYFPILFALLIFIFSLDFSGLIFHDDISWRLYY